MACFASGASFGLLTTPSSRSRRGSGCMLSLRSRLAFSILEMPMPVQGTRMPPHWSGYLTPMTQWTLLQAPGSLRHTDSPQQHAQLSRPHPSPVPVSLFDCLWCETNGNYFIEYRNLQRSREQRKANRTQTKPSTSKGKPLQGKPPHAALAVFAGEASHVLHIYSCLNLLSGQYLGQNVCRHFHSWHKAGRHFPGHYLFPEATVDWIEVSHTSLMLWVLCYRNS